jgi:hypothetical protein
VGILEIPNQRLIWSKGEKRSASKETMAYANLLARPSKIASGFYSMLRKEEKSLKISGNLQES